MTLMAFVQVQLMGPDGTPLVDVFNRETIQLPGPPGPLQETHGDLFAGVIERLADDVKERGMEQARQFTRTP